MARPSGCRGADRQLAPAQGSRQPVTITAEGRHWTAGWWWNSWMIHPRRHADLPGHESAGQISAAANTSGQTRSREDEALSGIAHLSVEEHTALRQEIARATGLAHRRHARTAEAAWHSPQPHVLAGPGRRVWGVWRADVLLGNAPAVPDLLPRHGGSCWNHVQVPADMARERICGWLAEYVGDKPGC